MSLREIWFWLERAQLISCHVCHCWSPISKKGVTVFLYLTGGPTVLVLPRLSSFSIGSACFNKQVWLVTLFLCITGTLFNVRQGKGKIIHISVYLEEIQSFVIYIVLSSLFYACIKWSLVMMWEMVQRQQTHLKKVLSLKCLGRPNKGCY